MINDKYHRPVYRLSGEATYEGQQYASLHLWNEEAGEYQYDSSRLVRDILAEYPNAVRHVERRSEKNKPRHPDVHYRPTRQTAWCVGSVLTRETVLNAVMTTDVSRVTCKACLKAIKEKIKR